MSMIRYSLSALLIVMALLWPTPGQAQLMRLDTPLDSPLWWTLTNDLKPAELRHHYTDRSLTLARYDAAVKAGLEEPLPEQGPASRDCLQFYFHSELTPELEPMWLPFQTFYTLYTPGEHAWEENVQAAPRDLQQKFSVSPTGVDTILRVAATTEAEFNSLMTVLGPKQQAMARLLREVREDPLRAASAPPEGELYDAVRQKDYPSVAAAVGRPASEIRGLVDSHADWDVAYALIADSLPALKAAMTEDDWQGFRRYLLETVVPRQGSIKHFDAFCGGSAR